MSSKQYFEALCKAEAGEFIYKTVEGVEGIYQSRPRKHESDEAKKDRLVIEDPWGYSDWEAGNPRAGFLGINRGYKFFEVPAHAGNENQKKIVIRYRTPRVENNRSIYPTEQNVEVQSRYGFLWRGISRPHDRENMIAGGEIIVVDLKTNEVLGIRRGFVLGGPVRPPLSFTGIYWPTGSVCPDVSKSFFWSAEFVQKVVKPAR